MTALHIPDLSLVLLVGVSGSGKSTFAHTHFGEFEVVSSDTCRGWVSNDPNDQSATAAAFDLLNHVVSARLTAGLLTVVDATNVQPAARKSLVQLAREHDVLPVAIVLDVPESVCAERNARRLDRTFGRDVVRRQHQQLSKSLRGLNREGFRSVQVLAADDIAAATIERDPLRSDKRSLTGPFDVIGDVHGCLSELVSLLTRLDYAVVRDETGRAVDAVPPAGRTAVFLGDYVDRGPDSVGVLRLVMGMVGSDHALAVPGNHENKLVKALRGQKVTTGHGLAETLEQLAEESDAFRREVSEFCDGLVAHLVLDDGRLVVAHAGLKEQYHNRASGRVRSFALYGDTTGETDEFGLPVRYPWADDYRGSAMVLYGHTPVPTVEWVNGTACLDTGCVFGGALTALRYPEREVVSVAAEQTWYHPVVPLRPPERRADVLDLADVLGTTGVETTTHGRITVKPENAAGALEVMSRFTVDPHWLMYLPPTMSPCGQSDADGFLEHPSAAFASYRKAGVSTVICEEKHMGSRAVVLVCRDDAVARARFGGESGSGMVHTRTGRAFFDGPTTERLIASIAAAVTTAGLWDEFDCDWMLLDAELLPWTAKAENLVRSQYAAVGAAGRADAVARRSILDAATARGLDVAALTASAASRAANIDGFTDAYRRYVAPTEGLTGVTLAPFAILAGGHSRDRGGTTYGDRDHTWHLAVADRLVAADPHLFTPTARTVVDLSSADSERAAVTWWLNLTASGSEGAVVKPLGDVGRKVQPGIKVRGREYLRMVYGPDYTDASQSARLRDRNLGHKQSKALREHALGTESVRRLVTGEPLWRIHQAVFAVLALESEPVDPRL